MAETCDLCCKENDNLGSYRRDDYDYKVCASCRKELEFKQVYDAIQPGVEKLFNELNHMGNMDNVVEAFFRAVNGQHRYLQSKFFTLLWKFFQKYGSQDEKHYDARNEGAVKWARIWDKAV